MVCDLSNPVAVYHFTGNANDSSGNGRNGTAGSGATLTADKNSVSNQAYNFDMTSNGYIILSSFPTMSGNKSISMWVNIDNVTGSDYLFDSNDGANRFILGLNPSSTGNFEHFDGTSWKDTGQSYNTGVWAHIVWVFSNGGTTLTFYYNGTNVYSGSVTNRPLESTPVLGNQWNLGGSFYDGKMDEIQFFDRAIDSDTVTALFNGYDNPSCATGYSNKVLGVTPNKVTGVDAANISKVNGI